MAEATLAREAPAKLNVFLRVLGRREDGYHDIQSLILPISLADTVTARTAETLRVDLQGPDAMVHAVDSGGMNLALVAALALADATGARGAHVEILKRIPVAAGLGGGSTDAAATLLALNDLWGCGLELEALIDLGAHVGSDVPALLMGGPVLMAGRGERLEPVEIAQTWWVVVPFDFPTRSPESYRWWDETGGQTGPEPSELIAAVERGEVGELGRMLFNDLEVEVATRHPEIGETRRRLLDAGALGAVMSGSGPTVAGLARSELHARELASSFPGAVAASGPVGSVSTTPGRG